MFQLADPFYNLSEILGKVTTPLMDGNRVLHMGGTYLCMEGPAFSTRAESNFYRELGCSVIGMTNHSEARLAREAEIAYSSIAMSTDYDCWHEDHDNVSVDMIINNLSSNAELAKQIIFKAILEINKIEPPSIAHDALEFLSPYSQRKCPKNNQRKNKFIN